MKPLVTVIREAALVALGGVGLALLVNQLSPRGLTLTRDYFPKATPAAAPTGAVAALPSTVSNTVATTGSPPSTAVVLTRLRERGLQALEHAGVVQRYQDPRYEQERLLFIDARDDRHYAESHIPGAYQLDHYYPDRYLPTVLPIALNAEELVVYCNGGDCEDSEFAAVLLRDAGVPAERLYVYVGGLAAWKAAGLAVEVGERRSGELRPLTP